MSKPIIVKLNKNKKQFEILTKHGAVDLFRQGKLGWSKVTVSDEVYKNSSKGERYTNKDLEDTFGTSNVEECMKEIALHGEVQLTTQDRKNKTDEKHKQILYYIHKYYINPKTKQPHPITHIEAALAQTKFKADYQEPVEKQVEKAMKMLVGILVCKKSVMEGTLSIPSQYIGSCYNVINGLCEIVKENYTANGCDMYISVIPGNYDTLAQRLNGLTKGEFNFVVVGCENNNTEEATDTSKSKKKGKKGKKPKGGGWE